MRWNLGYVRQSDSWKGHRSLVRFRATVLDHLMLATATDRDSTRWPWVWCTLAIPTFLKRWPCPAFTLIGEKNTTLFFASHFWVHQYRKRYFTNLCSSAMVKERSCNLIQLPPAFIKSSIAPWPIIFNITAHMVFSVNGVWVEIVMLLFSATSNSTLQHSQTENQDTTRAALL